MIVKLKIYRAIATKCDCSLTYVLNIANGYTYDTDLYRKVRKALDDALEAEKRFKHAIEVL